MSYEADWEEDLKTIQDVKLLKSKVKLLKSKIKKIFSVLEDKIDEMMEDTSTPGYIITRREFVDGKLEAYEDVKELIRLIELDRQKD